MPKKANFRPHYGHDVLDPTPGLWWTPHAHGGMLGHHLITAGPCRGGADPGWHLQTLSAVQAPWLEHSGEKSALKSYLHIDRWIDGWMDGWIDEWIDRSIDRSIDGGMHEMIGRWIGRQLDRQKDGWIDG